MDCRIDHRSCAEQGVDLLPTVHKGVTVLQMEQRGIRTEQGNRNLWIKAAGHMLQSLKKRLVNPNLVTLLRDCYAQWQSLQDPVNTSGKRSTPRAGVCASFEAVAFCDKPNEVKYSNKIVDRPSGAGTTKAL